MEDYIKHSRFTAINMMREKANLSMLEWQDFQHLTWESIERLTETARLWYNQQVDNNNS